MTADATAAIVFALLSAVCFGGGRALLSVPLVKLNPRFVNHFGTAMGLGLVTLVTILTGQLGSLYNLSLYAAVIFISVGVLHFGMARLSAAVAIKNIGANQVSAITPTQVLYSFALAVLFLGERLPTDVLVGGLLVALGSMLIEGKAGAAKRGGKVGLGVAAALFTGLIFGGTPVLIKAGLAVFPHDMSATMVSYVAAVAFNASLITPAHIEREIKSTRRLLLVSVGLSGLIAGLAQAFRFAALSYGSVVLTAPFLTTYPIFTVIFSSLIARDFEIFSYRTVVSIVLVTVGAALVGYFSGV